MALGFIIGLEEALAFVEIEPLHNTSCHARLLQMMKSSLPTFLELRNLTFAVILFQAYLLIYGYYGCDPDIGMGQETSDGVCYNSIYGYSISADLLAMCLPLAISFFAFVKTGLNWQRCVLYSFLAIALALFLNRVELPFIFR